MGAFGTIRSTDEPTGGQHARALEPGRGRHAETPWQIPWKGWKDILWRTYQQTSEDRLLAVAAGVVFYALLAVFPAITALVSLYGLFASPAAISDHLSLAAGMLPQSSIDILRDHINQLTSGSGARLGLGFVFGLAVALWSANAGVKAIMDALNVVYEEQEKRGFIRLTAVSLAFTLAAIGAALLALGAVVVLPVVLKYLGLPDITDLLLRIARWPLLLVLIVIGLAVLYRYGPSRRQPRWQWISVGSVIAAVAWLVSSAVLSWYLASFADYNATYGSLGAGIGMMMWMWISSIVILLGAQLNSEIEHQTVRDSTVDGPRPLGVRGAIMADTVGKAH
jgi:membrane protein